jgi:hypothetical protein
MTFKGMSCGGVSLATIAFFAGYSSGPSHVQAEELDACRPLTRPEAPLPPVPSIVGDALFNELIAWIAINTSYNLASLYHDPPTISFCQVGEIIDYEHSDLLVDAALLAAFDRTERHIYLTHPWSPVNLFDQSVLLHELIHDLQLQNRDWDCPGAPEREAYLLQDKWLFEHGIMHPFDWQLISLLSRCD